MARKPTIIIVIPCFNEANRLQVDQFSQFLRLRADVNFVMVDDGSTDPTLSLLNELRCQYPARVRVVALSTNSGKAEAVRQGVLAALESHPVYFGYWDADLATPLEAIGQFVEVLDRRSEIGQVIGTRLKLCGHTIHRNTLRCLPGRLFASTASCLLGQKIVDTQCGAKLFRTSPLTIAIFQAQFLVNWVFDVELMARQINLLGDSKKFRESIFEFPLERWDEVTGSKIRPRDMLMALRELLSIYFSYFSPFRSQTDRECLDGVSNQLAESSPHDSDSTKRKAA